MDTKKKVEETVEFTEEQNKNLMLAYEGDFINGLLDAVSYKETETKEIEIARGGRVYFKFRIRPLSEDEYNQCRKNHTKYVRNKKFGMKLPEDTDDVKYRCSIIYNATVEEDRDKLWDNRQVWKALTAKGLPIVNGLDVIEASLLGGEKELVIDAIDKLSGFELSNLEEVSKN